MIIDLAALRLGNAPLLVNRSFKESEFKVDDETIELRGPVQANLKVIVSDDRFVVQGTVEGGLTLTCCRCARGFPWDVKKSFSVEYWPDSSEEESEVELDYEDLDVGFYFGDQFDLRDVILEQLLIDIPMKPICREDCKGLCEQCGADLNVEQCSCSADRVDPRFEALRSIRDRMK